MCATSEMIPWWLLQRWCLQSLTMLTTQTGQWTEYDTITLTLSEAGNAPGGVGVDQDKTAIDALFTSSTASSRAANVLGADYDGSWTDAVRISSSP